MNSKEHNEIYNLYQSIYQEQIDENLFSNVERLSDKYVRPTVGNLGAQKGRDKATGMYDKTKRQLKSGKIGGAINTARSALETLTKENYDTIKGHLIDEGFADTEEAAHSIMISMSEGWKQSIVENTVADRARRAIKNQRDGYHGDDDALTKEMDATKSAVARLKKV